jgi:hypothetical protein
MRGISLRSRLASAVLVRDLWVVRYSLPAGLVVLGVEFFFLIKTAIQVGQGKVNVLTKMPACGSFWRLGISKYQGRCVS